MTIKIKHRSDSESNWISANPILLQGELAHVVDLNKIKIGNGVNQFSELSYIASDTGSITGGGYVSSVNGMSGDVIIDIPSMSGFATIDYVNDISADVITVSGNVNAHIGTGGSAHAVATTGVAGFITGLEKQKLSSISATPSATTLQYAPTQTGILTGVGYTISVQKALDDINTGSVGINVLNTTVSTTASNLIAMINTKADATTLTTTASNLQGQINSLNTSVVSMSGVVANKADATTLSATASNLQTQINGKLGTSAQAADSLKLNGQSASYYATASSIPTSATFLNDYDNRFVNVSGDTMTGNLVIDRGNTTSAIPATFRAGAGTSISIDATQGGGSDWRIGDAVGATNGTFVIYDYTNSRSPLKIENTGRVVIDTAIFNSNIEVPTAAGICQFKAGTGDGASSTVYNMVMRSWWGIGFRDYSDNATVKAWLDCRSGRWNGDAGFWKNGVEASYSDHNHNAAYVVKAGDTMTGQLTINHALRVQNWSGNANDGVVYFGTGDNYIYRNASVFTFNVAGAFTATMNAGGTIWTANNDGAGSGLDADLLDGMHANNGAYPSTIAARDGSGYLFAQYFNQASSNDENPAISQFIITNGTDNYLRKASIAHVKSSIGIANNSLNSTTITNSGTYTAAVGSSNSTLTGISNVILGSADSSIMGTANSIIASRSCTLNGGSYGTIIGSYGSTCNHNYSSVMCGDSGITKMAGSIVHAGISSVSSVGGGQSEEVVMKITTNSATATPFTDMEANNVIPLATGETIIITANIVAMQNTTTQNAAGYVLEATYKNVGGTISVVGTTALRAQENNTAWNVTITTTTGGININAVGAASVTIYWIANIRITRVKGI